MDAKSYEAIMLEVRGLKLERDALKAEGVAMRRDYKIVLEQRDEAKAEVEIQKDIAEQCRKNEEFLVGVNETLTKQAEKADQLRAGDTIKPGDQFWSPETGPCVAIPASPGSISLEWVDTLAFSCANESQDDCRALIIRWLRSTGIAVEDSK